MQSKKRATIGLALGSGAAKGWAHIGVLNGLKKMGIEPDKVAGCSIGSLVGAAYANDHLEQLQSWVEGFSSWDVLGMMDLSWRKGGLMGGEKVFDQMQASIGAVKIEDLKRPFTAVATDLYTGQEIWFQQGDLRQAVRASCSMPGILSPVRLNQRWLVDGAVVNPVPVSVARAMDVDIVIAVDLSAYKRTRMQVLPVQMMSSTPCAQDAVDNAGHKGARFMDLLAKGKEYVSGLTDKLSLSQSFGDPGMLAVMSQSMEILEMRHKRARLMGDPPDICLAPKVADIGTMEFHRASEAIAAGEQAVIEAAHLIEAALSGH
ncbi:patatin-like phospholipase RssA [Shewanella sp. SNU WT4]|uniref:patatin-like phospholipase RssA n=1 Tax=Shewanella sp. SNU WT4 TaxID=2590015 RepID=UPI00112A4988|nr:patatin-like phospholipase RssA [Shewanella sp. SNU WT4]QDF66715.1 patatin-like phospholipase RssA [Shewanella sp. SNU WT4]